MKESFERMPPVWSLAAILLLSFGLLLAGCSDKGEAREADADTAEGTAKDSTPKDGEAADEDSEKEEEELVPVEAVRLEPGEIEAVLRFSTHLEAESEVQVFSQAARLVTGLLVEEGDRVRKGQILLRLQDDEQRGQLTRVQSQLGKAQREFERQKNLHAQDLISEQTMNDSTYEVEQLEIAVEDARRLLSYTEVKAPISGTITGRHVNLGDHITVNHHLFDMVDFDTIVARVYVPEKELARLRVGQSARLYSSSLERSADAAADAEGTPREPASAAARIGEVLRIAPIVDPRSGTIKVTVKIPGNQGLVPGMYVEAELVTETHTDTLLVPKRAVVYENNEAFLYRLADDMRVERLRFEVLLEDREFVEPAPGSDLRLGDEIVIAGQAGLKSGVKVRRAGEPIPEPASDADEETS